MSRGFVQARSQRHECLTRHSPVFIFVFVSLFSRQAGFGIGITNPKYTRTSSSACHARAVQSSCVVSVVHAYKLSFEAVCYRRTSWCRGLGEVGGDVHKLYELVHHKPGRRRVSAWNDRRMISGSVRVRVAPRTKSGQISVFFTCVSVA